MKSFQVFCFRNEYPILIHADYYDPLDVAGQCFYAFVDDAKDSLVVMIHEDIVFEIKEVSSFEVPNQI